MIHCDGVEVAKHCGENKKRIRYYLHGCTFLDVNQRVKFDALRLGTFRGLR